MWIYCYYKCSLKVTKATATLEVKQAAIVVCHWSRLHVVPAKATVMPLGGPAIGPPFLLPTPSTVAAARLHAPPLEICLWPLEVCSYCVIHWRRSCYLLLELMPSIEVHLPPFRLLLLNAVELLPLLALSAATLGVSTTKVVITGPPYVLFLISFSYSSPFFFCYVFVFWLCCFWIVV